MLNTIIYWISFGQPPQQGIPIFLAALGCIIVYTMLRLRKGPR